jgi:clan AA aspartic protease (TIGR02281 family)
MRKLGVGLLIFMAGWILSWLTYHSPGKDPLESARPVIYTPVESMPSDPSATGISSTKRAQEVSIESLLQQNAFDSAVDKLESLQLESDESAAAETRTKILSHASKLLAQSRFNEAEQLLLRLLVAAFRNVEARTLLAEVYLGEQNVKAAIDQLYEARGYAYRTQMLQHISSRIRSIVAERSATLKANNDQNALLALYLHLTQLEPDHAPWFIQLAGAQLALEDREAALRSLVLVSQDPDVGAQAQIMLAELTIAMRDAPDILPQVATTQVTGIPLQRKGNHFIVAASPSQHRSIRLLIDTGASLTMLAPEVFEQPGIRYKNTGRSEVFNTANGRVRAPVYILDTLAVGDSQVNQLEVGVLAMGDANMDGLLGMNFLRHFQFFIDQNEALLRLSLN